MLVTAAGSPYATTLVSAVDDLRIELRPVVRDQLVDRGFARHGPAIRPVGCHRVVGVAREHDPCGQSGSPRRPGRRDSRVPSQRSWHERTTSPTLPSSPPTRSSMNCPSIVWCLMTSNSLAGECGRLVQDFLGNRDLPDVVQHRRKLQLLALVGGDPELVCDGIDEVNDRTRVLRRVLVFELEHVRQQHDRASIGAVELERRGIPCRPVLREVVEQPHQRGDHGDEHERLFVSRERRDERYGGEHQFDTGGAHEAAGELHGRHSVEEPVADDGLREVRAQLRGDRECVHRRRRKLGGARGEGSEDQDRREVRPGVRDRLQPAILGPASLDEVRDEAERTRCRDQDRYVRQRQEKQHRNYDELLGHDEPHAELEAHLRDRGVSEQERCDQDEADVALRGQQHRDEDRGDAVEGGENGYDGAFARVHRARSARTRFPYKLFSEQHVLGIVGVNARDSRACTCNAHLWVGKLQEASNFCHELDGNCREEGSCERVLRLMCPALGC